MEGLKLLIFWMSSAKYSLSWLFSRVGKKAINRDSCQMEVLKNMAFLHFNVTALCSSCLEFHWGSCSVSILCLLGLCSNSIALDVLFLLSGLWCLASCGYFFINPSWGQVDGLARLYSYVDNEQCSIIVKTQNLSLNDMEVLGVVLQYHVLLISSLSKQ